MATHERSMEAKEHLHNWYMEQFFTWRDETVCQLQKQAAVLGISLPLPLTDDDEEICSASMREEED